MDVSVNQYIPNATIGKTVWLKSRTNWDRIIEACQVLNISDAVLDPDPKKLNKMLMAIIVRYIPRKAIKFRANDQPCFDDCM